MYRYTEILQFFETRFIKLVIQLYDFDIAKRIWSLLEYSRDLASLFGTILLTPFEVKTRILNKFLFGTIPGMSTVESPKNFSYSADHEF